MNTCETGASIRRLREARGLTQAMLADRIGVSSQAVSKWETGRGLPDIVLLEPLADALGVSVMELLAGDAVVNRNAAGNLLRANFYVCPVCGNIVWTAGSAALSCCGRRLSALKARPADAEHTIRLTPVEDERYLTVEHAMTKEHYISFIAWVTADQLRLVKCYPEGGADTRLPLRGKGCLYLYCTRHGLMKQPL